MFVKYFAVMASISICLEAFQKHIYSYDVMVKDSNIAVLLFVKNIPQYLYAGPFYYTQGTTHMCICACTHTHRHTHTQCSRITTGCLYLFVNCYTCVKMCIYCVELCIRRKSTSKEYLQCVYVEIVNLILSFVQPFHSAFILSIPTGKTLMEVNACLYRVYKQMRYIVLAIIHTLCFMSNLTVVICVCVCGTVCVEGVCILVIFLYEKSKSHYTNVNCRFLAELCYCTMPVGDANALSETFPTVSSFIIIFEIFCSSYMCIQRITWY